MRKRAVILAVLFFSVSAFAGFKVKLVKAKKAEQFQARTTVGSVTYAADLLLDGKDQKDFFYKELTPSDIVAVRLAVFNAGKEEVQLPGDLKLLGADGGEVPLIGPDTVARAVLEGMVVSAEAKKEGPVAVQPGIGTRDPRTDPNDPRYDPTVASDPRLDPRYPSDPRLPRNDPRYPSDPRNDPRYDPSDPRNRGYGRRGWGGPSIVLNPGGGGGGDLSQFEKQLVEKDFNDKAHTTDPIPSSMNRDRFLFFSLKDRPATVTGFTLRLPKGKGIPEDVVLKF